MKKVVERVQRENETLKKSSAPAHQEKISALEQENSRLKVVSPSWWFIIHVFALLLRLTVTFAFSRPTTRS